MSQDTSWESSDRWYDSIVGKEGHYYHQKLVLPNVLRLLELSSHPSPSLLDLASGQGVLARALPKNITYHGIDLSPSLVETAKRLTGRSGFSFSVGDICEELPLKGEKFSHATIILALQNVASPEKAIQQAAQHLLHGGTLVVVLNHPCFRIPRQSHWGVDERQKLQYRRIDRYMQPLQIPIQTNPGKGKASQETWSFHYPISSYSKWFSDGGLTISLIEEWISDKKSTGRFAKMENRAREEFPLFFTFKLKKYDLPSLQIP